MLYLRQEGIVFASDLLFVGCHPYLADGDPFQLLKALKALSLLEATCFVPGHGPVGTDDDLRLLIEYVEYCLETAQRLVREGNANSDRLTELAVAERYQHWQLPRFFQANIGFLCQRLNSTNEKESTRGII